jgi:2-oxoglutarate ferredoxin oxidoreductase subunit gamma
MSQEAYEKYHEELSEGGVMIFEEDLVRPEGLREGIKTFSIPATRIAEEIGRKIVANIVMLGFFTAVTRVVSFEAMRESIRTSVPKGTEDLNIEAFERGYEYGRKVGDK